MANRAGVCKRADNRGGVAMRIYMLMAIGMLVLTALGFLWGYLYQRALMLEVEDDLKVANELLDYYRGGGLPYQERTNEETI